jgi:DNA repair protein RecN (Recombination protein N)
LLRELRISGLGVIDEMEIAFGSGLNVITGETGAGKTLLTVGLALALGRRAAASLVRPGAGAARVQARFDATDEAVQGGWADEGELVLARQVSAEGRSTARVGGQLAPVSVLAELGAGLVEVHGQHQGLRLLSPAAQTAFLDRYAGPDQARLVDALASTVRRLEDRRRELEDVEASTRQRERELDLLRYQIREIEAAAPAVGETAALEAEEARLAHAERLQELVAQAGRALGDERGGSDALEEAAAALRAVAGLDPGAEGLAARAIEAAQGASDLARELRGYGETLHLDPARLDEIRGRIAALRDLTRKYGPGEAEVLAFAEAARGRVLELDGLDDRRDALSAEVDRMRSEVRELAERVSRGRRAAAQPLERALVAELEELGMSGARAEISLRPLPAVGAGGAEGVELLFAGGPSQPMLSLSTFASGGELSRTVLACRSVLVDLDDVPTLVFDEVDVGIGGQAAVAVGRRLARLAGRRQVIVVTHLPQIAAFGDRHLRVDKRAGSASVEVLDDPGRVAELTRMLSGLPESATASMHAGELLAEAQRVRAGG